MENEEKLFSIFKELNIKYDYYSHPATPTIEIAKLYWKDLEATHCKNLFFRNHKGDRHYLVLIEHTQNLNIRDLEQRLKQGKFSFASEKRMEKYLGIKPGSVSPFALINDKEHHVFVFIDENLRKSTKISFHPCVNTASIVVSWEDFMIFLHNTQNKYEFIKLYD